LIGNESDEEEIIDFENVNEISNKVIFNKHKLIN